MSKAATQPTAQVKKPVLIIYGGFGLRGLHRAVADWSRAVVFEMDARLPRKWREQALEIIPGTLLEEPVTAQKVIARAEELLDAFLNDQPDANSPPGLETGRAFRAASLSLAGRRLVVPYVRTLLDARAILAGRTWEGIIVSPGTGICIPAWRQAAAAAGLNLQVIPQDQDMPPLRWKLARRLRRWWLSRQPSKPAGLTDPLYKLPEAVPGDPLLCVDSRLHSILGEEGAAKGWRAAPVLNATLKQAEIEELRTQYRQWWQGWWSGWTAAHAGADPFSDHHALQALGEWSVEKAYPVRAVALKVAWQKLAELRPRRILLGSTLGSEELIWGLAAREQGVETIVYTLDDPVDPRLSFPPDMVLADDSRQMLVAEERGVDAVRIHRIRTHRLIPHGGKNTVSGPSNRPLAIFAASFHLGHVPALASQTMLWPVELLVETARRMPGWDFLIKFHPTRERPDPVFNLDGFHHQHLWLAEQHFQSQRPPPNIRLASPETRLSTLLPQCSALLHVGSYAAMEAFHAGVPVIYLVSSKTATDYYNAKLILQAGALKTASDPLELSAILERQPDAGQIQAQASFIQSYYLTNAPSATEVLAAND